MLGGREEKHLPQSVQKPWTVKNFALQWQDLYEMQTAFIFLPETLNFSVLYLFRTTKSSLIADLSI